MYVYYDFETDEIMFVANTIDKILAEIERMRGFPNREIELGVRVADSPVVVYECGAEIGHITKARMLK